MGKRDTEPKRGDERVSIPLDPQVALKALLAVDPDGAATSTPAEVAVEFWGASEGDSRSQGARRIRALARELFPENAPGQGGEWALTREQVAAIRARI